MLKALTVSAAKPKLGKLLDKAGGGQAVYLRRKDRLFHLVTKEGVAEVLGRVSPERRRALGRKINEILRLLL